jgi:hypothetical protein
MKAYITKSSDYRLNLPHTLNNTAEDIREITNLEDLYNIYKEFENIDLIVSFADKETIVIIINDDEI